VRGPVYVPSLNHGVGFHGREDRGLVAVLFDIRQGSAPDTHGLRGENGGFQRLQVNYDWTDSVEVTAGIINYMSGDKLRFQGIDDNDRLFAKVEYRF
jgi:hypothetical protein